MAKFLERRQREPEWMDAPDADPRLLQRSLLFIRAVNRCLGYTRATLTHLDQISRGWKTGQVIRLLDVATGSGDIPRAILQWASRRNLKVHITAVDLHHQTLLAATEEGQEDQLRFVRADATHLPFEDRTFDCVLCSMFLHHLDESVAVDALREMGRVSNGGVVVADLLRSAPAYRWITLFTLLANPMVRHDARVSVSGAFSIAELVNLSLAAGLSFLKPHEHFGHRAVLAGEKDR